MPRLKSLRLSNFKSIGAETQEIEFAPMTLLFGPNSAGKSTVLQALIFAREVILYGNTDPDTTDLGGDWLDLGGFENLVHGRVGSVPIGLGFTIEIKSSELPSFLTEHESQTLSQYGLDQVGELFEELESIDVDFRVRWSAETKSPYVEEYSCKLNGAAIAILRASSDGRQVYIDDLPLLSSIFQDPLDFLDEERSLSEILRESISQAVVEQSTRPMRELGGTDRPYINFNVDELEEFISGEELPRQEVLEKILDELGYRKSRRAATLEERVSALMNEAPAGTRVENVRLNILGQSDALPPVDQGLVFEEDTWSKSSEDAADAAFRTMTLRALDLAICGPLAGVSLFLENMNYIGPLRDLPPRQIEAPRTKSTSRWAKGIAAWESLPIADEQTVEEINYWLGHACLDSGYQVRVETIRELSEASQFYQSLDSVASDKESLLRLIEQLPKKTQVRLEQEKNGLSVMPQDIGVGISQLFPVIVASVLFKEWFVAIEQPELHVHPRLQTELADLFIRYSRNQGNQFLLETHSEHLMLRLLRRIRDSLATSEAEEQVESTASQIGPNDLAVHYVESTKSGTNFTSLRVSEDGDFLDEWPEGFFDERDQELFF